MLVAVIGSGASGLTAIKTCKEGGLDVICYERSDNIGGLWRYRDDDVEGLASVTKSTIINTSKELTSFSDFPPPKEYSNFMHNTMMYKYLQLYAQHFDLVSHIKFRHRVEEVVPTDDYESTGRWNIKVTDLETGEEKVETVDAVLVCTGHHVFPYIPTFPGQEKFRGRIIHTHSYKKPNEFEDKSVVVVGVGNSGGDAAVETSTVAKKVYLSTRRGCWVLNRVGINGRPNDDLLLNRFKNYIFHFIPFDITCNYIEKQLNVIFDHEMYNLKPNHRIVQQHPMINDALPNRILSGTIVVKNNIKRFEERGVVFENEEEVTEVDDVILATGYSIKFPFLSKEVLDTSNNRVELYKYVFPHHLKHPTLAIIGLIQSVGGLFPISEMQCRWFVQLLKKNVSLPTEAQMKKDINYKLNQNSKRYYNSQRHTIQVDYIDYLDEMASLIGVRPNFFKLFITDPKLYKTLIMGPSLPYQYRLRGPHSWPEARDMIMKYEERLTAPLKTRKTKYQETNGNKFSAWKFLFPLFTLTISVTLYYSSTIGIFLKQIE